VALERNEKLGIGKGDDKNAEERVAMPGNREYMAEVAVIITEPHFGYLSCGFKRYAASKYNSIL
jgi:hypothetical protein